MPASVRSTHPIPWVAGQVHDLVLRQAGHRRADDRSGEPVPCFDELVLRLGVAVDGVPESFRVMTGSMAPRPTAASRREPSGGRGRRQGSGR
jgi:hypothetical protein